MPLNLRRVAVRGAGLPASGQVDAILATYRALPHRQLVMLFEPGAGKTGLAMLLMLGLIEDPAPDDPLPVIFVVASWNPAVERLEAHLAQQLVRDHAELAAVDAGGRPLAARLLAEGRMLPVSQPQAAGAPGDRHWRPVPPRSPARGGRRLETQVS
ncbi:hypothetical protein KZZ52_35745 [Dactylosporangium sp. AC04546]|uniref:hypothetical protein n=1 Tax=Dactylosporangium sp. AC04546 TaxID=2862460 RepID=UPI001EDE72D7|nr:hypothetical protein [Dactylosporangium sp. AC04546]WVK79324.1 hypothetical protein KZZ52_35745 [Dactylosporangium sp. AC04546]